MQTNRIPLSRMIPLGAVLGTLALAGVPRVAVAQADEDKTASPVVVYPVVWERHSGTTGSRAAAVQALRETMSKAGYPVLSNTVAETTWKSLRIPRPTKDNPPTTRELVRFGRAMKARYVLRAHVDFHSRSIWVNFGPKTISTVKTDVYLFDVSTRKAVYTRKGVQGRSDERTETLKVVAGVLISPLVTVVSGGPKTPQEQRAAQISIARAMQAWLDPTATSAPSSPLAGTHWMLAEIAYNDDKVLHPYENEKLTLDFSTNGRIAGRAGINRFSGPCKVGADGSFGAGALVATRAANPPDSIADTYLQELARANRYLLVGGKLVLQLPLDTGVMKFERASR